MKEQILRIGEVNFRSNMRILQGNLPKHIPTFAFQNRVRIIPSCLPSRLNFKHARKAENFTRPLTNGQKSCKISMTMCPMGQAHLHRRTESGLFAERAAAKDGERTTHRQLHINEVNARVEPCGTMFSAPRQDFLVGVLFL